MKYDKLVRDKTPEIIAKTGKKATFRILTIEEYKEYLEKKLDEEVAEFHDSKSPEELADILEVLDALAQAYNISMAVMQSQYKKRVARGNFSKRICLIEIQQEEDEL